MTTTSSIAVGTAVGMSLAAVAIWFLGRKKKR